MDVGTSEAGTGTTIDAATVVLLRDVGAGVECLMLRKNAGQAFGGMWVFPGGKVEDADGEGPESRRRAAVREAFEETGLVLDGDSLVPLSHWVPPEATEKRFSTWFFVAALPDGAEDVVIDGGEIGDQMWTTPWSAIERHRNGEVALVPPTWVTLRTLADAATVGEALAVAEAGGVPSFRTRFVHEGGESVFLWAPDVAYEGGELAADGPRHRLLMRAAGWEYERSGWGTG
jgi:8-oxo-dGTP pyrophosphatase MutT (NUDIX family)